MTQSVYDKVVSIIANQFNIDASSISEQTRFKEDLHADSIELVELIMDFEETFGGSIPDEDAEKIKTVKDIVDYINNK